MQKVRFWDPEHWRFRPEATRTVADQMTHEEARTIMRRIANDYDRLATGKRSDWRQNLEPIAHRPSLAPVRMKACCDCASRGNGFNEQIFGVDEQVPGCGQGHCPLNPSSSLDRPQYPVSEPFDNLKRVCIRRQRLNVSIVFETRHPQRSP